MTLSDATDQDGHASAERFSVEAVNSQKIRQPLYAARRKIFPKRASGTFRHFKWLVMLLTLGVYYLTPFLRWDRGPFAPDKAVKRVSKHAIWLAIGGVTGDRRPGSSTSPTRRPSCGASRSARRRRSPIGRSGS